MSNIDFRDIATIIELYDIDGSHPVRHTLPTGLLPDRGDVIDTVDGSWVVLYRQFRTRDLAKWSMDLDLMALRNGPPPPLPDQLVRVWVRRNSAK